MKTTLLILTAACALVSAAPAQIATPTPAPPDYVAQLAGPTPSPNSPTAIAAQTASQIPHITQQLFGLIKRFAAALWKDPTQAQGIVDSLGEKAAPLFVSYGEFVGPLALIDPVSYATLPQVPAGYSWTIVAPPTGFPNGPWPAGQRSVIINYTAPAASSTPTPAASPSSSPTS